MQDEIHLFLNIGFFSVAIFISFAGKVEIRVIILIKTDKTILILINYTLMKLEWD